MRLKLSIIFLLCFSKVWPQNWKASSFDVSLSYLGLKNEMKSQLLNEFLSLDDLNHNDHKYRINYPAAKGATIYSYGNNPGILFLNFNYAQRKNTRFLFYRDIQFIVGLNLNFWNRINYYYHKKDSADNYYNEVTGSYFSRRYGLGINTGLSLLSVPILKRFKFQTEIMNSFCPLTRVTYTDSKMEVYENLYGDHYSYVDFQGSDYRSTGRLLNNLQLKLGLRFNLDCNGNVFFNYTKNYISYTGKPDIAYRGFSDGFEFGFNFLIGNDGDGNEAEGVFW